MILRRLSVIVVLICMSLFLLGQSDFRPGFYITPSSDSIYGLIDYRGDNRNSRICVYKSDINSEQEQLGPEQILGYRFTLGKYYLAKWVETEQEKGFVFLEYLVNGIMNLYYLRDAYGDHYFLETVDGILIELTNEEKEVHIDGRTYLMDSKKYVGVLKASLADCQEIQKSIDVAEFSHKSLINLTSTYHDYVCDGEKCIIYQKEIPRMKLKVSPIVGYSLTSIHIENYSPLKYIVLDQSYSPYLGLQLDLSSPRINEKISLQIESGITKHYHYAYHHEVNYNSSAYLDAHITTWFLQNTVTAKYTFPKGKFRPTAAAGILCSVLVGDNSYYSIENVSQDVVRTNEYSDLPVADLQWGWMVQMGMNYHLNWRVTPFMNLRYHHSSGLNYSVETRITTLALVAGIYF